MTTKIAVNNACVFSTLLHGSETWTTYARQEKRLNTFHLRSLRRLLGISWQDKVTNKDVLSRAGLPTVYTLLRQLQMRWLDHVRRNLKRHLRRAERRRSTAAEVLSCVQERYEGAGHQHKLLGGSRSRPHQLKKHASKTADW